MTPTDSPKPKPTAKAAKKRAAKAVEATGAGGPAASPAPVAGTAAQTGSTVADLAGRGLDDLRNVVDLLAASGRLARVRTSVDPELELGGVARRFHGGKAVVFDKVKGSRFPVLTGLYWNRAALADIFGVSEQRLPFLVADAVAEWQQSPLAPVVVPSAPVQEVVEKKIDLGRYPISRVGLDEGGPYMTAPVVIAKDPDTGVRNACIVRWMVTGRDRLAFLLDMGRHLRDYYERAEARGEPLQVTINVGVNPAVHFAAVVPPSAAPIDTDELGIAGHLLGRPLELVPGRTVNVEGVASAQFILEAELLPHVRESEGPAAEVTGYYAERADRWVARVTGITRRKQPLWHTIIPGQEVYNAVGLVAEASIFRLVSRQIPGLIGVRLSYGGCGFYHAVVQMQKGAEGMQRNAILATFGAFPSLKQVTVVDEDVDIHDPQDVEWAMATRFRPDHDIILIPEARGHELNPVTDAGIGCKVGFDATAPTPRPWRFQRLAFQPVDLTDYDIIE